MSRVTVRTLEHAAAWVDEVGLALLLPKADVVLPSLWEEVNGSPERNWAVRDADGTFRQWTREMDFLWRAKDDLPARGLVCVGKHLARAASCIAPRVLPMLVAANGDRGPEPDAVTEAVREHGPLTGPQLREVTGLGKKEVERRIASLHRSLVLTNSHLVEQDGPWGALAHDLLARKWRLPGRLPARSRARRELAALLLERAGELTAADLSGALGWRRTEAADVLEEVGEGRDGGGFRIWTRR
jgi:winged helix DNA-binding protein